MLKRDITQLAVYHIEEETDTLFFPCLRTLYLEKTSDTIYITRNKKLYGIIDRKEVLRRSPDGKVKINKSFTILTGYNVIKAHEIFQRNIYINKIPVINEQGELLGDYSRWDDMLYIERNQARLMQEKAVRKVLGAYDAVYVVEPVESKNLNYLCLVEYLKNYQIEYTVLEKAQIGDKLPEKAICIFLDEDERRGIQCFYGIEQIRKFDFWGQPVFGYDTLIDTRWKVRLATYKSLLFQIMKEDEWERLSIKTPTDLYFHRLDDKATILLSALEAKGLKCINLHSFENEETLYGKNFLNEMNERLKVNPPDLKEPWSQGTNSENFFGELYQLEDYRQETAQKEIFDVDSNFGYKEDVVGKYFNARDGRRVTCFQPEEYIGTIYFLGPCIVLGVYVEDQYTIESYLQKSLLERGYKYRVENYGDMIRPDGAIDSRLEEIGKYSANDIVIYLSNKGEAVGIQNKSLEKIYEKYQIPSEWVTDGYVHCNHKANKLIADDVLDMLEPCLSDKMTENKVMQIDIHGIMKEYVQHKYLDQYFSNFSGERYDTVGAIVMVGNCFNNGHRYLIEQAKNQVDFLIVFVVEEELFLFPFEERFQLIKKGTDDLSNIMIVPSGDFILSRNNFPEFFSKRNDGAVAFNVEYDIKVFADYIAEPLHITHRFVAEEHKNKLIKAHIEAMRRILPQKGINYVEIPRMVSGEESVKSSTVCKSLKKGEYDKAFDLLPGTTQKYLGLQMG